MARVTTPAANAIGIFDAQTNVGRARRGSASYDKRTQTYTIAGSGQNMWNDRDDFHFVWKRISGDFILSTRARFTSRGVEAHRKLGWSIRPSLEANAPHVTAALHGDGLVSLQYRRTAGGITEEVKSADSLPRADAVIQLERRGGVYLMSVARFGDTLATEQVTGVALPDTVYIGLYVCAHNDTVVERAAFSNVRITIPAKRDLVPYRDYLGSNLEILDLTTGNATIVHQYHGSFQAPNWTHDGKALIYAQEGRLYRFDLTTREPQAINTGFATRNNNDHVLSFDGRMLAISHHATEDSGASIVYTVPSTGGTPKRITAKGPSYLHGWSPDGRWLVFTGQRNNDFDVYKISSDGGEEVRLTSTPGLDDGPEFTPDGRYIYFNSSRTGRMQIWRMRPDGSEQQQITNDGFNNWFPHISPDGKRIVYISFPPEVAADDHPFYKHVLLRLMPVDGGASRVIAYVYGGQGTINVPSWSPDGRQLAFVSNTGVP
jgi:dipeptidyl aminopeptidase/acylaminoacyl peptidase